MNFAPTLDCAMRFQEIYAPVLARHRHEGAYAALVLKGSYEEFGDQGRLRAQAGDVILHGRFETHLNRFEESGAVILNLTLAHPPRSIAGLWKATDPDQVVRLATVCEAQAADLLLSSLTEQPLSPPHDWPELLAATLIANPSFLLTQWAEENSIKTWTLTRGFSQVFGASPEAFRANCRARQAWTLIITTTLSLADIAAQQGFSDQAHMCRSIRQLTGESPRAWRTPANGFKTKQLEVS